MNNLEQLIHDWNEVLITSDSPGKTLQATQEIERLEKLQQKRAGNSITLVTAPGNNTSVTTNKVFIIHGHDEEMRKATQSFIMRCGLQDIVLHEQPNKGRTIIKKLIEESADASYVIALLSPDDVVTNGDRLARQNVILEIGYFLAKLGEGKVAIMRKENTYIPSDLQGILYVDYDAAGNWETKMASEMLAAGLAVNVNKAFSR